MELIERMEILREYFETKLNIGNKAFSSIQNAMTELKEKTSADVPNLISAEERCISYSDDLNWIILLLKRKLDAVRKEMNKIKSPTITMLINKGRMGNDLINQECLYLHEELYDLMDSENEISNILEYLQSLNDNLNKRLWIIREKLKF